MMLTKCIIAGLIVSVTVTEDNEFNCPKECGLYSPGDSKGPKLHNDCKAFDGKCEDKEGKCNAFDDKCIEKENKKKKNGKKKRKKSSGSGERIVNGFTPSFAMPWMVLLLFDTENCGGALINTQFVITAAHCPCKDTGADLCSRGIGTTGKGPAKIKDEAKVKKVVFAFIGATCTNDKDCGKSDGRLELSKKKKASLTYPVKKLFIHPKLGTSEKYAFAPDLCLVQLAKPVSSFSNNVRPVCLSTPTMPVKVKCADDSRDRDPTPQETKDDLVPAGSKKILGGCATVAGWGGRYSEYEATNEGYQCTTDESNVAPDKTKNCVNQWTNGDESHENCTKEDIKPESLVKACRLLMQELSFMKAMKNTKFQKMDLNEFAEKKDTPVEVIVKRKKKVMRFHCGKTDFSKDRKDSKWPGWCATKLNNNEKIVKWGMCTKACLDDRDTFQYTNMNLLTDEECKELESRMDRVLEERAKDTGGEPEGRAPVVYETEFCAGKKHNFPKEILSLERKKKRKKKQKEEENKAKKAGIKEKPTKYYYKTNKKSKYVAADVGFKDPYPYKWFIGGTDSCQGDSGGPLWRNVKDVNGTARAYQIGVVARGNGCAYLNFPGIYGSIKYAYPWIKETIEKEMKGKEFCPK